MLASSPSFGQTLYVRPTGSDLNTGTSWATAKQTVQAAIDLAGPGWTILIAEGVYLPTARVIASQCRTETFLLGGDKDLRLRGGYAPDGSGVWNPRPLHDQSPGAYQTVLSGQLPSAGGCNGNAFHVVTFAGATEASLLDGVVVRDGLANGNGYHGTRGAGVLLRRPFGEESDTGQLDGVVQNCHITFNTGAWGAGLSVAGGRTQNDFGFEVFPPVEGAAIGGGSIRTTLFDFNAITWRGAGGVNVDCAHTEVFGCVVTQNSSPYNGAGLQIRTPTPPTAAGDRVRLINCTIALNAIVDGQGTVAGVYIDDVNADPEAQSVLIENCIIAKNDGGVPEGGFAYDATQFQVQTASTMGNFLVEMNYTLWAGYLPGSPGAGDAIGIGNMWAFDPVFVDATLGSPTAADLRLKGTSPCINVGQPDQSALPIDLYDADQDGNTTELLCDARREQRVRECRVEMGAYEGRDACTFDLDGVNGIGPADLAILLGLFGTPCSCPTCALDVDGDGLIGSAELAALLGDWAGCTAGIVGGGDGGSQAAAEQVTTTPIEVASLLGFESVDSLALWLASLEAADRHAVVMQLFGVSSGGGM